MSQRNLSFILLIGAHVICGQKTEDHKWKMYVDVDECEDSKDLNAVLCIRDVKFLIRNKLEQYSVHRPPFIMKQWAKGIYEDTKISCTIVYQDEVITPRKTTIEYQLDSKNPITICQKMSITLEYSDPLMFKVTNTHSNTSTNSAITLLSSNNQLQNLINLSSHPSPVNALDDPHNVWKKRNLENAMNMPQESQPKNTSNLWSGIVSGKIKSEEPSTIKRQNSEASCLKPRIVSDNKNTQEFLTIKKNGSADSNKPPPVQQVNREFKRAMSGFGRGKFVTNANLQDTQKTRKLSSDSNQSNRSNNNKPFFF